MAIMNEYFRDVVKAYNGDVEITGIWFGTVYVWPDPWADTWDEGASVIWEGVWRNQWSIPYVVE